MKLTKTAEMEALLFASGDPLTLERAAGALFITQDEAARLLEELQQQYRQADRGIQLRKVAGGWQLVTKAQYFHYVERLSEERDKRLSPAAMETLSIVAFKQPITKQEIEHIRGVRIEKIMSKLLEMELIRELGRKDTIGRPILYGTTDTFLQCFGLNDISDLPELPEADRSILEHEQLDLFAEAELPEQESEE